MNKRLTQKDNRDCKEDIMGELETRAGERPYWETIDYAGANQIVKGNLLTGQKAAIAIGYYLKHIRENRLYLEGGYQSFGEYVKAECGLSESAASRHISRMEQFSEGGNSPKLADRYLEYSPSQLQEMLYLTDDQRETVTPDMTVREIREIRKPEPEPEPEPAPASMGTGSRESESVTVMVELPALPEEDPAPAGPVVIEGNLEELLPGEEDNEPKPWEEEKVDESHSLGELLQAKEKHLRRLAEVLLHEMGAQMIMESRGSMMDDSVIERKVKLLASRHGGNIEIGDGIRASACSEILEFFRGTEDLGISTYTRFATQARKAADVWAARQKEAAACAHDQDGVCEVLSDAKVQQPCVEGPCPEETWELHDEQWFALQIYQNSHQGKEAARICAEMAGETSVDVAKRIQKEIAPYGCSGHHYKGFSVTFNSFVGGIDCEINGERCHLKYGRLARELTQLIADKVIAPEEPGEEEKLATSQENAENKQEIEDDLPEPEQVSADPDQETALPVKTYDAQILQEQLIDDVEGLLNVLGDYWREKQPELLTQHLMMLEAYELLREKHEKEKEREAAELAPDRTFLLGILHSGLVGELQSKDWKGALNTARNLVEVLEGICEEDAKNEPIDSER